MAKKITGYIKLQVPAGSANPSPPIGPALGQRGLAIMEFCKQFNAQTQKMEKGSPIPVVITVYQDRSFTFEMRIAASMVSQLRSFIFCWAISRTCALVTVPALSRPGVFDPLSSLAAFLMK